QRLRIEHDPVADQAYRALDDPRGNLVEHELPGAGVDRVACVRPALIAHDEIGALGEHVDDLPFALVAPLGADDHDAVGLRSEHRPRPPSKNAPESGRWSILRGKLDPGYGCVNAADSHCEDWARHLAALKGSASPGPGFSPGTARPQLPGPPPARPPVSGAPPSHAAY